MDFIGPYTCGPIVLMEVLFTLICLQSRDMRFTPDHSGFTVESDVDTRSKRPVNELNQHTEAFKDRGTGMKIQFNWVQDDKVLVGVWRALLCVLE